MSPSEKLAKNIALLDESIDELRGKVIQELQSDESFFGRIELNGSVQDGMISYIDTGIPKRTRRKAVGVR